MAEVKRVFKVNGKPFFPLGGQSHNSSGYGSADSETAFKAIKLLHGNSLEIPVYWDKVEPEEGKFDFSTVEALITGARKYGVKLILLWFASWKNGNMDYTPAWVKQNPQRFKRVKSPAGRDLWGLSAYCPANLEADKKALMALCKYLKAKDSVEQTIISIQVENEPWNVNSDRDFSQEAEAARNSPVPANILTAMKAAGKGVAYDIWQKAGGKKSGDWYDIFGSSAAEFESARSIAAYIDKVIEGAKAVYDIPMFINAWIVVELCQEPIPGAPYPAGGPVSKVLDIYKWCTPHTDMITPDIHLHDSRRYETACADYARDDNPLFDGEAGPNTWSMFRGIADYNCQGYFFFGVEQIVAEDGTARPESRAMVESVHSIASAIPLLLKYQGTGKIHAVSQEEYLSFQWLDMDGYLGQVQFGGGRGFGGYKDWRHNPVGIMTGAQNIDESKRGRGLVIQAGKNEFYVIGVNYRIFFRPKLSADKTQPLLTANDVANGRQVSVDEGHFDQKGAFVVDRQRNGDEISMGVWVESDLGVVRVILCD